MLKVIEVSTRLRISICYSTIYLKYKASNVLMLIVYTFIIMAVIEDYIDEKFTTELDSTYVGILR